MHFYSSMDMSEVDFNELGSLHCFQSSLQAGTVRDISIGSKQLNQLMLFFIYITN